MRCPACGQMVSTTSGKIGYSSYASGPFQQLEYRHGTPKNINVASTVTSRSLQSAQKLSTLLISAIVIVTLLLLASGVSLMYYAGIIHPTQLHNQATATAQVLQNASRHTTATAHAHATATVRADKADKKAAAIVAAQATAQVKAAIAMQQNMYARSTSGKPAFSSPLFFESGTDKEGEADWDIYPTKDGGGCAFTGNALHSSVFQANYYAPCIAHGLRIHNFALEIQMAILKGEEGGVIFRSNAHDKNFYSLRLKTDGIYALILTRDDGHTTPLIYEKSPFIKKGNGQANIVTVIARASTIYLYINKHYMGSASDHTYSAGAIGVLAIDRQDGTDVAFNNLRLWKL
ncbi:hypothetical protein KDA_26790 [Dictyobacter alpinus]|uniref:3-keto-disaccharide hydrolase domain-containing protein n=2 Tax=Dictyobacter alpinus TaxID=2014873 RepID=A0A402B764_9CHLR|nr:hypothetical protein KDA_26790 [Dictyobacter alpinus]